MYKETKTWKLLKCICTLKLSQSVFNKMAYDEPWAAISILIKAVMIS